MPYAASISYKVALNVLQVAEVIKGVVTREKEAYQHLRNITSKQSKRLVSHKLADLNGDKTLAAILDFTEKVSIMNAAVGCATWH
jgi:hypothetical protein